MPWLFAAFACLVVGFGYVLFAASQHQQKQHSPREQNPQNYETNSNQRSERPATVQKNYEPNYTADNSDHDRNTVTQFLHKFLNDPLTVVTLLLVIVVFFQIRDSRHSAERQLRAYVLVKTALFSRPNTSDGDEQEWPIHLVFRNAGHTPAYAVLVTTKTFLGLRKPMDEIFTLDKSAEVSPQSVMAPEGRLTMRLGGLEPGRAKFLAAQEAEMYCYVWGRLDYIDTFGRKHFTKFQMWHGFGPIYQFGFVRSGTRLMTNSRIGGGESC